MLKSKSKLNHNHSGSRGLSWIIPAEVICDDFRRHWQTIQTILLIGAFDLKILMLYVLFWKKIHCISVPLNLRHLSAISLKALIFCNAGATFSIVGKILVVVCHFWLGANLQRGWSHIKTGLIAGRQEKSRDMDADKCQKQRLSIIDHETVKCTIV